MMLQSKERNSLEYAMAAGHYTPLEESVLAAGRTPHQGGSFSSTVPIM